jgi:hypothetical protein
MRSLIFSMLFLLGTLAEPASASVIDIDLMQLIGPPGSWSPYTYVNGPCYCTGPGFVSQIYAVNPGEAVNLGTVEIFPIAAGGHSNGQPIWAMLLIGFC